MHREKNRRLGTLRYPSVVAWPAIGWGGAFATDFPTAQAATPVFLMCANAPAAASRRFLPSQAKDRQQQEKNAIMNPLLCVCVCVAFINNRVDHLGLGQEPAIKMFGGRL